VARRSRHAIVAQRKAVLALLRDAPAEGLHHQEIRQRWATRHGSAIPYTTLRVRLDELVAEGTVIRSPESRNPRYWAADIAVASSPKPDAPTAPEIAEPIPVADDARRAGSLVRRPRSERTPVGYDLAFLDRYVPGQMWYLEKPLRDRLRDLGSTTYAGQPAGTYARDIMQRLIIDLSWGSSQLEGLKYSRIDTKELLESGRSPAGATDQDRQLILNHKAAIEFLVEEAESIAFNRYTIFNLHALLSENLLGSRDDEGKLRTRPIEIGASVYTPTAIPQLIEQRFDLILTKAAAIPDPIEQAFFMMVHLPYLQPFIDVNKRTSRLAANIPLIKANLCPLSFVDVPERAYTDGTLAVYELNDVALLRDVFAWAYERSCAQFNVLRQAMGEPDPIRLNYRSQLRTIVADIVRSLQWPTFAALRRTADEFGVPAQDAEAVAREALSDLETLRPEILARYALRPREYDAWKVAVASDRRG
jgi:hypothetical protein